MTPPSAKTRVYYRSSLFVKLGAVLLIMAPSATAAEVSKPVRLRHRLMAGGVTVYTLRIETARGTNEHQQRLTQTAKLTRVMFAEDQPGQATCAQMIELEPAAPPATQSAPADRGPNVATPPAERWVQFSTARVSANSAPLAVPGRTAWSREVSSTVLRVTDWPEDAISAGDGWQAAFRAGSITGRQRCRVEGIEKLGRQTQVKLAVQLEPEAPAETDSRHVLSAQAVVVFSASDGELLSLDGRALWRESAEAGGGEVATRIVMQRGARHHVAADDLASEREAVSKLAYTAAAYQRQDYQYASRSLQAFAKQWPRSRWQPVADYLDRLIKAEGVTNESLTTDELRQALTRLTALWHQAQAEHDQEVLEHCRSSLSNLTRLNRPEISRLLADDNVPMRASACLALAFGSAPADLALIQQRCQDADAQVRQAALRALTVRASPLTDAGVLLKCLMDGDAGVRRQACEAVGLCVGKDSTALSPTRQALHDRFKDDSIEIALAAATALRRIGSDTDLADLARLAETTSNQTLRAGLRKLLADSESPQRR